MIVNVEWKMTVKSYHGPRRKRVSLPTRWTSWKTDTGQLSASIKRTDVAVAAIDEAIPDSSSGSSNDQDDGVKPLSTRHPRRLLRIRIHK